MVADDFVDDTYYTPQLENKRLTEEQLEKMKPSFNKHAKEIVFVEDTLSSQSLDTIKATILNEQKTNE